jgi:anti-sigma factor RsiW
MLSSCPPDVEIRGFAARQLDATEQARIERHLADCSACTMRLNSVIAERESAPGSVSISA